ncbi:MAG: hypothetical protein FD124_2598 [Alphaproteobacteria bacterium]|nr:MAG: hypothetical protein FD160_3169 [Caulobacteraceae bacterium]TPW04455.1 MAG: hypothetical protein FD124_2598 [Alphaproteobacteria bacterium]
MSMASHASVIPGRAQREPGTQEFKRDSASGPLGSGSPLRFGRNDGVWFPSAGGNSDA